MTGSFAAAAILLASILIPTYQASAQITPTSPRSSLLPEDLQSAAGLLSQDPMDFVQNITTTNITQLATVLPTVNNQPIISPLTAVNEESDESSNSNDDYDDDHDDENNSNSNDNDDDDNNGDDDSRNEDNDRDGRGGGRGAFAVSGGAFAMAG
jgi:hypothetical protein